VDNENRKESSGLKFYVATFLSLIAVGIAVKPHLWYVPIAILGAFAALAVTIVAVEQFFENRRRCPRCEERGFASVLDGGGTTGRYRPYLVAHCRQCNLYRLECGPEVRELDAERWVQQVEEWEREDAARTESEPQLDTWTQ
jgi:hypothetical protein